MGDYGPWLVVAAVAALVWMLCVNWAETKAKEHRAEPINRGGIVTPFALLILAYPALTRPAPTTSPALAPRPLLWRGCCGSTRASPRHRWPATSRNASKNYRVGGPTRGGNCCGLASSTPPKTTPCSGWVRARYRETFSPLSCRRTTTTFRSIYRSG